MNNPGYPWSGGMPMATPYPDPRYYAERLHAVGLPNRGEPYPYPSQNANQALTPNYQPSTVCVAVTNIDEARATRIDPMGVGVFTDFANGKIYVKRTGNDGTAQLTTYSTEPPAPSKPAPPTSEELAAEILALNSRIKSMEEKYELQLRSIERNVSPNQSTDYVSPNSPSRGVGARASNGSKSSGVIDPLDRE